MKITMTYAGTTSKTVFCNNSMWFKYFHTLSAIERYDNMVTTAVSDTDGVELWYAGSVSIWCGELDK